MKVYLLVITNESAKEPGVSATVEVYLDKDAAINDAKWMADCQKRIEGNTMTERFEYGGESLVSVPGFVHEGTPVFAIKTRTQFAYIDSYMWRAVFEKDVNIKKAV